MPKPFQACGLHLYTRLVATYAVTQPIPYPDGLVLTMTVQLKEPDTENHKRVSGNITAIQSL